MRFTEIHYKFDADLPSHVVLLLQQRIYDLAAEVEEAAQLPGNERFAWNVTTLGTLSEEKSVIAQGSVDRCRIERAACVTRATLQQDVAHVLVACTKRPLSFMVKASDCGGIILCVHGLVESDDLALDIVKLLKSSEGGAITW